MKIINKIAIIFVIILSVIYFGILYYHIYHLYNNDYNAKILKSCFISIENFVTLRQSNITKSNSFEMKTYASSYSTPYLIELIQQATRDCLCCPI